VRGGVERGEFEGVRGAEELEEGRKKGVKWENGE
jgi:hypothetical protein